MEAKKSYFDLHNVNSFNLISGLWVAEELPVLNFLPRYYKEDFCLKI